VARGSGIVFAGQMVGKVFSFVLQILLSRVLGAAAYGLYNLGMTVLRFGREFSALGLQGGIVRFGSEAHGKDDVARLKGTMIASLTTAFAAGTVLGLGLFLGDDLLATRVFSDPDLAPVLRAFAVALPFYVLVYIASRGARALQNMKADVTIHVVSIPAFNLVTVAVAFLLGYRLGGATMAFVGSTIASAALGLWILVRLFPTLATGTSASYDLQSLLWFSLPVLGANLATVVFSQADRIMLGILATSEDVGVYHAAAIVATQVQFILTAVNATFTPIISDLYHRNLRDELHRLFKTTTRWIVTLSLPLALVLLLFPDPIMQLFGSGFDDGSVILIVLAIATFFNGCVGASGLMLQMSDHENLLFANNIVLAVSNVGLNVWFILEYGPIGAALATGGSIVLVNTMKVTQVHYLLDMHPFSRAYLKPFAAGAVAAVVGWGTTVLMPGTLWAWLVGMPGTVLVYGAVLVGLGFTRDDWSVLAPLLRRLGIPISPPS
jgi:O-antigen/teichoic acid export membrane protein